MMNNNFSKGMKGSLKTVIKKGLKPASNELIRSVVPVFNNNPFQLGVASGDPHPDGVVLWTRLAPEPLAENSCGGMPDYQIPVEWEVAEDQNFQLVVKQGFAVALPELAHSVHVELEGLEPSRYYYYRFKTGSYVSPVGRTKTAPAADADISSLSFAMASCQAWYHGYFTAYKHMAAEDLDFVFFLGDYIYEYAINTSNLMRPVELSNAHNTKVVTLDQYRLRYSLFKTDPDLQAAHAAFPWIITWDDHEVENNYADEDSQYGASERQFLLQRADAYQAHYENLPLRSISAPEGPDMRLYRNLRYGNLAEFNVLDTRQYRDDYSSSVIVSGSEAEERLDPERTILGEEQEQWLMNNLQHSNATWNVLAQQVVMAQVDRDPGIGEEYSMDMWDGFVCSRDRIFSAFKEYQITNPVVLSGDIHRHAAANLKEDFNNPCSETIASEFVVTSIASDSDGSETDHLGPIWLANEHVKLYNAQRGYVRCHVTPDQWRTDHLVLPYITRKGAPIETYASFIVENGQPGLQEVNKLVSAKSNTNG
ncbi:alkaline phosphatase D family protein [Virgibacillus salexigens]|uniref:Alkaline phosphatase D n=1 Tax=Virgibacillus massiliensis TaxID=1462526 RepID=A0A024QDJ3_9BACI|nr:MULTISPECIES: alkaline phosphatase D family protein [Virgibacillus]MYL42461.1 alkaline phosphatase [Virgibacillus massiliensis]CDQ40327.1 Alkaline phosphatase D precursor [Virgibacillus massiliensis]